MSLVKCPECNNEISSKAKVCPTCGKKLKKGCLKYVLIGFIALVILGSIPQFSKSPSSTQSKQSQSSNNTPKTKEKQISDITWFEIDSIYNLRSNFTDLQKKEEWKKFKGERIKWSGTVSEITEGMFGGLSLLMQMNPNTLISDLKIDLNDSEKSKALKISKGSTITFTGTLYDWGSILPITLQDGIIVE